MVKKVTKGSFRREVLEAAQPTLMAVMVSDCVWCKELEPILAELAEDGVNVAILNDGEDKELEDSLNVDSFPCIIAYAHGSEYDRLEGYHSKAILAELAADGANV